MNTQTIPSFLLPVLSEHGIKETEILSACRTDMNTQSSYLDGLVILSAQVLVVLSLEPVHNEIHDFKGYISHFDQLGQDTSVHQIAIYPLDIIEKLSMEGQIASNLLILTTTDHQELRLCAFSNLYKKKMHDLIRTWEHTKHPEEEWIQNEDEEEFCPVCGRIYPDKDRHICPKCMDKKSIFFRVLLYFKPYKFRLSIMFFIYLITAVFNLIWPYLSGKVLYDQVLAKSDQFLSRYGIGAGKYLTALALLVIVMLATKLSILFLQIIQGIFTAQIATDIVRDMKKDVFHSMGRLSISFFKSRQTGSLMTRVLEDAEQITGFFIDGLPYIFIFSFSYIATIIIMFRMEWKLSLVACILLPVTFMISFKLRPHLWTLHGRRHRASRALNSQVNDNLTGARVVKAFGQEERELHRFAKNNQNMKHAEMSIVRFSNFFHGMFQSSQEIMNFIIWAIGIWLILNTDAFPLGIFITFIGYVGQLSGPMNFFARIFQVWAQCFNSAQRMFEIMDSIPQIVEADDPISLPAPAGEIELKNVTFGYETNKPILKDISLHIMPGQMLGIVGRSGAGKTTLVNLISRMYDPSEGTILIDGIDLKQLSFHDLRRNVAVVSQETYLFMGTVEENIAYANPNATKAEIIHAACLASAHEFILRMPDGYDTRIGSSGRELSGGERQRISIARAILANPKILILDEATASVDTETEKAIQRSINYLIQGRTTISIAHRLSTLRDADSLIVIDNGKITERGTKKELMELHGTYYKLMELQTKALALQMFQE